MKGNEIKKRVDTYKKVIENNLQLPTFTLNKKVLEARNEILKLQKMCQHEYDEEGNCIYCGYKEQEK